MAEQLTPEEVVQLRALLAKHGIENNVPMKKLERLPPARELGVGRLDKLGVIGRCIAWAWKHGRLVLVVLMIPIDCCDLVECYVPRCHVVVEQVASLIDDLQANPSPQILPVPSEHRDRYYAYNPEWRVLADDDLQKKIESSLPPTTLISSLSTTQAIINGSAVMKGLS